ncbi:MAG: hypothetical protein WCJ97_09295 [Phycisphaerae bacterium]
MAKFNPNRFASLLLAGAITLGGISALAGTTPQSAPASQPAPTAQIPTPEMQQKVLPQVQQALLATGRIAPQQRIDYLIKIASETTDPAAKYVILDNARKLAMSSGDIGAATKVVNEIGKNFVLDHKTKAGMLVGASLKPADYQNLGDWIDQALQAGDYDSARKLVTMGRGGQFDEKLKEVNDIYYEYQKVKNLVGKDDPASLTAVGRFTTFYTNDWANGLPLLAKGADTNLKTLAELDKEKDMAVADGWWDVAAKLTGVAKTNVQNHAVEIYKTLDAKGLDRAKVDQRIAEVESKGAFDAETNRTINLVKKQKTMLKLSVPNGWSGTMTLYPDGRVDGGNHWTLQGNKLTLHSKGYIEELTIQGSSLQGRGQISSKNPNGVHELKGTLLPSP